MGKWFQLDKPDYAFVEPYPLHCFDSVTYFFKQMFNVKDPKFSKELVMNSFVLLYLSGGVCF